MYTLEFARMKIDGQKVKRARSMLGLTQLDIAHAASITMATLSKIENGREMYPHLTTIAAIAAALHCDPKLLIESAPGNNDRIIQGV